MLRQIMVPLDGSDRAEQALPYAVQLAKGLNAALHLVRVDDLLASLTWSVAPPYIPPDAYEAEASQAEAYLAGVRKRLEGPGLQVRQRVLRGAAALSLLDYEREAHIDLVAMCSHGRSGVARFAFGSVADRILRHGSAPVLLVHAFGEQLDPTRVVVPLDESERAEAALPVVAELGGSVVREVTLLQVIDAEGDEAAAQAYLATAARSLEHASVQCRQRVTRGEPAQTIVEVAGAHALVIMATHGRSGLTRWALGSVADRVSRGGTAGVLLVRTGSTSPAAV